MRRRAGMRAPETVTAQQERQTLVHWHCELDERVPLSCLVAYPNAPVRISVLLVHRVTVSCVPRVHTVEVGLVGMFNG